MASPDGSISSKQQNNYRKADASQKSTKITLENANECLEYNRDFGILICLIHQYAIRNLENHLRTHHAGTRKEKDAVARAYRHYELRSPNSVPLPASHGRPWPSLGAPTRAFICQEPECEEISISRDWMRKHCNKEHRWKSSKEEREHWHQIWVQTFFNAAGLQRYFTVDYEESNSNAEDIGESDKDSVKESVVLDSKLQIQTVIHDWNDAVEQHKETLDVVDKEVAKTDRTAWFKRTGWIEHLANSNMKHLSQAIRMPDRDEHILQKAVSLVDTLIERAVNGLATLDQESRRWLRSAKQSELDVRPLARLQNQDSQTRYAGYMKKCVCYCMRVYQSFELLATLERNTVSNTSTEGETSDESTDDSNGLSSDTTAIKDILYDARRLFPWQKDLKDRIQNLWSVIESGRSEQNQLDTLLAFFESLIFQHVRNDVFQSCLLHFLAVLGIDDKTGRLRQANDYSYMLAGVVYCTRVLGAEILLPSRQREQETSEDVQRFQRLRNEYLADGSYSVMSKMISLLAYAKQLAFDHGNAGSVLWSKDGKALSLRGRSIVLAGFIKMVHGVVEDAENMLWRKLMWTIDSRRFEIPLDKLEDDVTWTKRGVSFINNQSNNLQDNREWMLKRAQSDKNGRKLYNHGVWAMREVRVYLREIDKFRELLLFAVHLTGGQPARGSEITTARFKNGFLQDRNVFAIHGHVTLVTRYHKSQSQFDKPKVIPRFLPWRVGQLLAVYLAYVQPFQEYLSVQVRGAGWSDYIWSNEQGPWETDRLTKVITRETQKRLGVRLTTHDYRHLAISIGRRVIGEQFAHGYAEDMAETEEQEVETDDVLELSAGRSGEVGSNRYGVPVDVVKHLSSRSVDTFRPLSERWHEFLQLSSYANKGQKRPRGESSNSTSIAHSERQMTILLNPNRITDREATTMPQMPVASTPTSNANTSGWWFGQSHLVPPNLMQSNPLPSHPVPSSQVLSNPMQLSQKQSSQIQSNSTNGFIDEGEKQLQKAVRKALDCENFSFKSVEQEQALRAIILGDQGTPLVVVLPTGGGKSLLFMAPACLDNPGVTIVVVPYRSLLNNLMATAQKQGIDCLEWRAGEVNAAALVFVSADVVAFFGFIEYAQLLQSKGLLRRIFVDECHLTFTSSDWRPKLAEVRAVRGLRCRTILLTATLPPVLEFELENSMAAGMARYVRSMTTRERTRYIVQICKPENVEQEAVALCERMQKHLGWKKGVVYSRSRIQCERVAQKLKCAYYHAGAVDNEERLQTWLQHGGFIIATSALGTGVDYPGIVFVLHIDLPYGMIDYAQESGRAGRGGEDVDSVIIVRDEPGSWWSSSMRGVDDSFMEQFVRTKDCRRGVMSSYLDGRKIECVDGSGEMARCDRCGEGLTALERVYCKAATERQLVEETLDEIADGCAHCWVVQKEWNHAAMECTMRHENYERECDQLRYRIRYDPQTHSCYRCGISQRICATGQDNKGKCQWPNVVVPILRGLIMTTDGVATLRRAGWEGDQGDWKGYGEWLGQKYQRRVWGELMSNAMVVLIETMVQRNRVQQVGPRAIAIQELEKQLRVWYERCVICTVRKRRQGAHKDWRQCPFAGEDGRKLQQAWEALGEIEFEDCGQCGQCWAPQAICRREEEDCEWTTGVVRDVGAALLGLRTEEVEDWIDAAAAKAGLAVKKGVSEWKV